MRVAYLSPFHSKYLVNLTDQRQHPPYPFRAVECYIALCGLRGEVLKEAEKPCQRVSRLGVI